jgi:hypothetical protein
MYSRTIILLSLILFVAGCTTLPPPMLLTSGAEKITIAKSDPGDNYEIIGPVSGFDGRAPLGPWDSGNWGQYERAVINLQNNAYELGGNYVQILSMTEPFLRGDGSGDWGYYIRATAFKRVQNKPSPTLPISTGEERLTKKLRELKKLLDEGVLSQDEYENQKAKLLKY